MLGTAPNFRDLAGSTAGGGARVRRGLLYRADSLARLDDDDFTILSGLGLRQVVDLRTVFERERGVDRVPDGAEYVVLDVQRNHSTGADLAAILSDPDRARAVLADDGAERFMLEVNRMLVGTRDACAAYRKLVERAAYGPLPLVFHCSAGKDRTGWGAALLLGLLGVPKDDVLEDYLASNARLGGLMDWIMELVGGQGLDPATVRPMIEVRPEYLEAAYAEIDSVYGGFDGYVAEGLRLDPATVDALRERLLH
ncbi:protein-tyrosine phosphatase [Actinorugispora endophytica]|uniref:Protein-tyrosine phosphatase n=1 Tax=Actinorugispora endophytica TaxID=1605990 RepID=A0A4V3D7N1_9ACTN|nr:protein-tyrosine phosphatase [Actinorugispora endophytica]